MSETARIDEAVAFLGQRFGEPPDAAVVLGSGLGGFADALGDEASVPCTDVPHWPAPAVAGHGGHLQVGGLEGRRVACLTGRVHLYEGRSPAEVVRPVRTLRRWGTGVFLLTNAAGGISAGCRAGTVMIVRDHLNLTGSSPLVGAAEEVLGPRFPDQSALYTPRLRERLRRADGDLIEGVYAGLLGPSYETPAEVRMLERLGADAVGMSTVHEAIALGAMGAGVAALSVIGNRAAGLGATPLSHDEVLAAGRAASGRVAALLRRFLTSK